MRINVSIHVVSCTAVFAAAILQTACVVDDKPDGPGNSDDGDTAFDTDMDGGDTGFVTDAGMVFPGDEWPEGDPETHGYDSAKLEEAAEVADEADSHCFMVVHGGTVIGEWYFDDWDSNTEQNVFSIAKSITGVAVGIAADKGYFQIEDQASLYISDWQGMDSESVTIRHLLNHTSGRYWDFTNDYFTLGMESDKTAFAVGLEQQYPPGTEWEYNNAAVQTLDRVMSEATGEPLDEFANAHLFSAIGMSSAYSRDEAGNTIASSDVIASCPDLARFGYLVLRNGRWGDKQIVSKEYLAAAVTPSSELNTAYGYLFWLNRDGHWINHSVSADEKPEGDGMLFPSLPEDLVLAEGLQDQLVVVDPGNDLVITRIGGDGNAIDAYFSGNLGDDAFVEELISLVLKAKIK